MSSSPAESHDEIVLSPLENPVVEALEKAWVTWSRLSKPVVECRYLESLIEPTVIIKLYRHVPTYRSILVISTPGSDSFATPHAMMKPGSCTVG